MMKEIINRQLTCFLLLAATALSAATESGKATENVNIRGAKLGNWWVIGEPVRFYAVTPDTAEKWYGAAGKNHKAIKLPANMNVAAIIGIVNDSTEKTVANKKIGIKTFLDSGWEWMPEEPGFYTVKFAWEGTDGKIIPIQETFTAKIGEWSADGKTFKHIAGQNFSRGCHNIAVLNTKPRLPQEIPPQAGMHAMTVFKMPPDLEWYRKPELDLTVLLGVNYLRVHGGWSKIATGPGQYDWRALDEFYNYAVARGFNKFIFNPFSTPRWASPHPERNEINICQRGYEAFLPTKMSYWTDYLTALMRRYPKVNNWELWNEPHLPGQSVFWYDTPENFVKLLQAGYECVKQEQPAGTVILGGIGSRYLPFYDKIMKDGSGKYFDVLAMHGQWNNPAPFHQIERQVGIKEKPWLNSEYYPLMLNNDEPELTEEQLSHNMLISFMDQLRQGASAVTMFLAINYYYHNEKETLTFFRKNKRSSHVAGFFRRTPYMEPRLAAVVWRNFIDCFSGDMTYRDGYFFAGGEQRAALMQSSKGGDILLLWTIDPRNTQKIAPGLLRAVDSKTVFTDWEGKTIKVDSTSELRPHVVYFLRCPNMAAVAAWKDRGQVLEEFRTKPVLDNSTNGCYRDRKLFGSEMQILDPEKLNWHNISRYVKYGSSPQPNGLVGRFAAAFGDWGGDFLIEVKDQTHFQNAKDGNIWQGDSVQIAIDAVGKGFAEDRIEFSAAQTARGPLLWKECAPSLKSDLPGQYTLPNNPVKYGQLKISRIADGLVYKIRIDRSDLYPFAFLNNQPVRMAVLVNNNDGRERTGWLEWGAGIGGIKDPSRYGTLTVAVPSQFLMTQSDLKYPWTPPQGNTVMKITSGQLKASGVGKKDNIAVSTPSKAITGGVRYSIDFSARGNTILVGIVWLEYPGKKIVRQDFLERFSLTSDWQSVQKSITTSPGVEKIKITLLAWQQSGEFEIKDFTLKTATISN